tara:strand:- start:2296 stop:2712 length:417 start_codon:yes stop_codon:yes gene_type:complete
MIVGTVNSSNNSISFETAVTVSNSGSNYYASVFDTISKKVIVVFQADTSTAGTAVVFQASGSTPNLTAENYIGISNAVYASGQTATIQVASAVDDAQSSLTPGQTYFVQTNGTLGTSAGNPSVIAGTAVSSTELAIKG